MASSGLNEYSWFWISGAVAICGISFAIAYGNANGDNNEEIEFAKAGLEQCIKSKGNQYTMWVKDCVRYLQYVEEGKYTPAEAQSKANELSPF